MSQPWLTHYPRGVSPTINPTPDTTLNTLFQDSVAEFALKPALQQHGHILSYADTAVLVDRLARYYQHGLNLPKGSRLALMMPNILAYPIAIFAALQAGLVIVNINPLYTPRELSQQLSDSGATAIVLFEAASTTLAQALAQTQIQHIIVANGQDLALSTTSALPNSIGFNHALQQGTLLPPTTVTVDPDDLAFLQYTGGTTGVAKGAMLSHANIVANIAQISSWVAGDLRRGEEVIVTALPLYHVIGLTVNLLTFTHLGALNVLISNPRDLTGLIQQLQPLRISIMTGVNTLFNGLLHHANFAQLDFSHMRFGLGGGMAIQASVMSKWQAVTGAPLIEAYGLTETSPVATINPLNGRHKVGSIGLPMPSTDVSIRDAKGQPVASGEAGELWIKGPQVMQGYWQRPEETAKVMDDNGYFASGDIARMDDEGYLTLVDRKKDMVLVSGFNVYPNEIEAVMASHPDILETACIGVPDERTGEALKLFVVTKGPDLSAEALIDYARAYLTPYKVPKYIEFRTDLPKSTVGKILRRALRDDDKRRG
ncbi:MAG: AMP-binding protein [Neisseriaceae bacterium]|nr:AMP-binding protein [Neisseriaceae bacterium]